MPIFCLNRYTTGGGGSMFHFRCVKITRPSTIEPHTTEPQRSWNVDNNSKCSISKIQKTVPGFRRIPNKDLFSRLCQEEVE